ncbi:universal stress protein [Amycolatopsis sp. BJA-103]|uniref:universal stress protein n=1 Tax=unclassified Amycolatopsis TaxID=2618356 RepID=UPI000C76BEAA|nr:universal stress protein [Amycolatopsis sp. BJA-103]AUI60280.1 universal stress protein [Amycolatopsis sp. BJA-103]PNE16303.1 universal stress protein [Amycolatopsis sp. BJA-103]
MNRRPGMERRIIVGTDGSDHGSEAIRWAITETRARGARLEILLVRPRGNLLAPPPPGRHPSRNGRPMTGEVAKICEQLAADIVIEASVRTGDPASELLAAAHGADLLVLGAHSEGPFGRPVFGRVSAACVRHATCPIVLVTMKAAHRFSPSAP